MDVTVSSLRSAFNRSIACDAGLRCYLLDASGYVIVAQSGINSVRTHHTRASYMFCSR